MSPEAATQELLSEFFGSYKAEWLRGRIFDLFAEPSYFPELQTSRPCVLVGGRGTGKTTVLRCLSYEGQFALSSNDPATIPQWKYYGLYYRVNTNRVTAFKGPELSEADWTKVFAHYFNLELCDQVLRFLLWRAVMSPAAELSQNDCKAVATSLNLPDCSSVRELATELTASRLAFEAYINNIRDAARPQLSLQGAPVDALFERLSGLPSFQGKLFFFLLDEYENFLDYQQQVINTLIKHASGAYTFKIGVRELGWRQRGTLNANEQLISPADYVRIDITEKLSARFDEFASKVCNERLHRVQPDQSLDVHSLLEFLDENSEAMRLGIGDHVAEIRRDLAASGALPEELAFFDSLSPLEAYFIGYWANGHFSDAVSALRNRLADPKTWTTRFENYRVAVIFTLRRQKRGIRKYYSGWSVFIQLAAGNIRYLLELLEQSLLRHLNGGGTLDQRVSADTQTLAAQAVGKKNLTELEGVSVQGAKLTKLLLGMGRVFQVMAANPEGHAPETNQFYIQNDAASADSLPEVEELLRAAVMHLALVRFPGNKLQDETDTRAYNYAVHPIFSPFFEFSYRKKRKLALLPNQIAGLVFEPKPTIESILREQGRTSDEEPLPEQLALFEGFYAGGAR